MFINSGVQQIFELESTLKDKQAAIDADDGSRVPHGVAIAIIHGENPVSAFRAHRGITLGELAGETGLAASYLSEIERGLKVG